MEASSSPSSSIQKSFKYDVFLSFRGTDTRKNFIAHLYKGLQENAIYTYKDDERIRKGKRIRDELPESIEESQFYIVVFSKNYASSSWCLDELVKIMECHKTKKHTAYPVFYDVEPTEVRHQTGAFKVAFEEYKNNEAVGKWRHALKEATDLAGWELKNTANGSETKFIQKIIENISLELYNINFSFDERLVGIESRVNDIVSSLQTGIDDVRMIGIKGMGGAGKTTLARAVFDKLSIQFEGKSFVENVRDVTSTLSSGLKSLQQQILRDVLNDKKITISGVHEGKNIMKQRMRGRKVLIALDDVNDIEQLEALAGQHDWFKWGSRIIVTTRDAQVLVAHGMKLIHDVNLLSNEEAICLFNKYAFRRDGPVDQGYEKLSEQVVRYACGLPLTIKVLGSLLYGQNKPDWEDALLRLKTIPLAKTLEILELSYTALEGDLKEIFLDVACMLKGWRKKDAVKALESCGFRAKFGLRVLQQKSLLTIDGNERVGMHDHIEEMGWNIVRRSHPNMPHKHNRLWKNEEIEHILANDLVRIKYISKFENLLPTTFMVTALQGTQETRCLRLNTSRVVDPYIIIKGLGKMKELRFLHVEVSESCRTPELNTCIPCFSDALGYMCVKYYPFRSLPKTFQTKNLVSLEMPNSKIEQLWVEGEHKVLDKLRFLDLSRSKLRTLDLRLAPNLETLDLRGCRDLVELPDGMWMLKHLRSLKLFMCKLLKELPKDLGHLECLEDLDFSDTEINHLPDSICMLKHLKSLNLSGCKLLEKLPEDLGRLECLKMLWLKGTSISHIPQSILLLKGLRILGSRELLQSAGFTSQIKYRLGEYYVKV